MSDLHIHIVSFDIPYPANYGGVIDVFFKAKFLAEKGVKVPELVKLTAVPGALTVKLIGSFVGPIIPPFAIILSPKFVFLHSNYILLLFHFHLLHLA